ncbi:MAG TPA: lysophospholipid acyltransferase family protein [Myxococcaceae bacterium]|jgi:1-acyl-sn-glycerol-3-phosphate acyltransferase
MIIKDILRTVVTWTTVVGGTLLAAPVVVALAYQDKERPDPLLRFWSRSILAAAGVRVEVHGQEHLPQRHCVFVCNHQSHFDVLVMVASLQRHVRFVAKAELFKIPVFSQAMRAVDTIKVDRSGGESDRHALAEAIPAVQERMDIVFFPEGTRSPDGVLRSFKKGAVVLALNAGVPIVPLAVAGTRHILPKGSLRIHGGRKAALMVGEPISVEGRTLEDRDELIESSRRAVASLLERANAIVGE